MPYRAYIVIIYIYIYIWRGALGGTEYAIVAGRTLTTLVELHPAPWPLCRQPGVGWGGGESFMVNTVHFHIGYRILDIYIYTCITQRDNSEANISGI